MKRATILILALLLVAAARADAKFSSVRVCGSSDCRAVTTLNTALTMMDAAFKGSHLTSKPPEASPWYQITLCPGPCDSPHAITLKILPASGYAYLPPKGEGPRKGWVKLDREAVHADRKVTTGLEPFPASRLIALGAEDPSSSDQGGIPAWPWIAIGAAVAAVALPSRRWLQRSRRRSLGPR